MHRGHGGGHQVGTMFIDLVENGGKHAREAAEAAKDDGDDGRQHSAMS